MRKTFPGYYRVEQRLLDTLWSEGLLVPDSNVLLNLYRYSPETGAKLLSLLEGLRPRLWIPYQVAFEFERSRLTEVAVQHKKSAEWETRLDILLQELESKRGHPFVSTSLLERVKRVHQSVKKELRQHANARDRIERHDPLFERVMALIEGLVGEPFSVQDFDLLLKEGERRFQLHMPPGFMDDKKKRNPDRYGDLFIWEQILRKAESRQMGVIFVTDDLKEDWWLKNDDGDAIGPHPALREEFTGRTKMTEFHMYDTGSFMHQASTYLKQQVPTEAIKEVKEVQSFSRTFPLSWNVGEPTKGAPEPEKAVALMGSLSSDLAAMSLASERAHALEASIDAIRASGFDPSIMKSIASPASEALARIAEQQEAVRAGIEAVRASGFDPSMIASITLPASEVMARITEQQEALKALYSLDRHGLSDALALMTAEQERIRAIIEGFKGPMPPSASR